MGRRRKSKYEDRTKPLVWQVAIYIRLSREDGQEESNSVTEQRKMLLEYIEKYFTDEFVIIDIYVDDGLTGTDDTRDNFKRMMNDVYGGKINCIVCKTLSRAFRNYADQGKYLEEIFPSNNIRFISMGNPHVDSYTDLEAIQNGMEIPINGLMNDRYAAKISADIRRTFEFKMKRGEFIGAFAPYGYIKDPNNNDRLLIDKEAADIVRNIFVWFIQDGMSKMGIAKKLTAMGVLSPAMYKRQVLGLNYQANSAIDEENIYWNATAIKRILTNEIYLGRMVQGKSRTVSYKIHQTLPVPETAWAKVPDTHEAIIPKDIFDKAQLLHGRDTRTAPGEQTLHIFSGMLQCFDCKRAMRRKKAKQYVYYCCRTQTDTGKCSSHTIREDRLTQAVLSAVRMQVNVVGSISDIITEIAKTPGIKPDSAHLPLVLQRREKDLQKVLKTMDGLYFDWKNGDITKEEYKRMRKRFNEQKERLTAAVVKIKKEMDMLKKGPKETSPELAAFLEHKNITALQRGILVTLIDKIYVRKNGGITIDFNFTDELKSAAEARACSHE